MTQNNKNEKVVHTRVSSELFNKILDKAKKNRISTSNLIRNLVEDYLEIHDEVWEEIDKKIKNYSVSTDDSIVGYQPIVLIKTMRCSVCGVGLKSGAQAFVGVLEKSSRGEITCQKCCGVTDK